MPGVLGPWRLVRHDQRAPGSIQKRRPPPVQRSVAVSAQPSPFGEMVVGESEGAAAGAVTSSVTIVDPNQLYVAQVYQDVLQRPADPPGLAYWTGKLDAGTPRAAVAGSLTNEDTRSRISFIFW